MPPDQQLTADVKALAAQAGFARAGVAPARALPDFITAGYEQYLRNGYQAQMGYLARDLDKRFRPNLLVDGARSVISLAVSYSPSRPDQPGAFIAPYARGPDYHDVLAKRARRLMDRIAQIAPNFAGRAFVDAAPIMERSLAALAGIGWIGRNGALIAPDLGSYIVLCEIVCNLPLAGDSSLPSQCNDCDACVRACPTRACLGNCMVDARRCLSYLSIEHRGPVDEKFRPLWGRRVFGCDACQAACPHNKDAPPGDPELIAPTAPLGGAELDEILTWTKRRWAAATRRSTIRRAGYEGLMRNAILAAAGSGDASLTGPLGDLRRRLPQFAELIDWATARLSGDDPN